MDKNLIGKIKITGKIICKTGLHIGASKENVEIGTIDSPVVRDPITREPYIPGSSIKGKMRSLLEKALAIQLGILGSNNRRNIGTKNNPVYIHVCDDAEKAIKCPICRLFGSTGKDGGKNFPARLIVRDANLTKESIEKLNNIDTGLQYTEWKFENAIDRVTSSANPRQLERVPRGAEFEFEIIYNVEDEETLQEDIDNLSLAIELLKLDALGGHGSRGYGKVEINFEEIVSIPINDLKTGKAEFPKFTDFSNTADIIKVFSQSGA
ncbi:MAG: type III-A CRISPR-associated RAMP protein Csm3 [Thermodesulfovibrio sp.]|jgi:CRISPR-associated protein Csm3|uniref:type III-A CRISPR-associated RAMP protein Csm3 n=1 Tax=unclassified Thermodesulfovibrio TaxID=2645936 RepID=UPI00083B8850|nr:MULTISPECIES: type III-A CRISPR-associated RAMP protein Csm3 [unclassified Thermodesulfovibrio]MDI1471300.1 type III-A CRISPR-associated RAMP protein Csm3 [Thermodesulfovibrio sp. 1176]MDI6714696.1 type III-A CRISPR-associated RAMP protein Csm3 [Thermodesulfovibrio sp.]ODA43438.1 CRISPR-associated RAMP Csm3 [Thermodesulfovibrio sp. N1]